ncbi:helix-turn-helix transcriptional regulator [Ideonella sp. BN130291]|uniref:helix-turn-helix transcriptional regulator n=1 Tax=Ideonella sp. BN130291 TaxID=3112940 RepID=UPI002E25C10D|nr:autoinducer binding domain-containing protein [Ideonella sp. BN130291]
MKDDTAVHVMSCATDRAGAWNAAPAPEAARRTGPTFYTEEQLEPVPRSRRPLHAPSVVNDLLDATSAAERQRIVQAMLHAIGFQWLGYGAVALERGVPMPLSFLTSYAHPQWTECYFRERYYEVDLRHHEAAPSSLPLVWDIEEVSLRASTPQRTRRHRQFAEQLRDSGLRSGVFLNLASWSRPQERTVISFASGAPRRDWIVDGVLGQTLVLALCLHEFLSLHVQLADGADSAIGVSSVQQEILRALVQGLSDKEIANQLHMSAHTVDYHMRQLRRHFGARNRVQLVNAAMQRSAS